MYDWKFVTTVITTIVDFMVKSVVDQKPLEEVI